MQKSPVFPRIDAENGQPNIREKLPAADQEELIAVAEIRSDGQPSPGVDSPPRYLRADVLTLVYASKDPDRPGFGSLLLRHDKPQVDGDPNLRYSGTAIVHQCDCQDGTVTGFGKVMAVPATLSINPVPSQEAKGQMSKRTPQEIAGASPTVVPVSRTE